ncbi:hypothetical protein PG994_006753 [Apiospora phragmitis]|uniref:Ankyrin repeat protein n=1 Tax=Apiospora phragmitis TaxID=2905665 RepID=A0ABR1VG57_9PEZI
MGAHTGDLRSCEPPYNIYSGHGNLWRRNSGDVAILRLLIERGADPFPTEKLEYPFTIYLNDHDDSFLEFFQALCELTVNNKTHDRYLFGMLKLACAHGRHKGVQTLRSCAPRRVDTIIRDKAVFFLQTLLAGLHRVDVDTWATHDLWYIREIDEAIDLMELILALRSVRTLTSRWRLREGRGQQRSALEFLEKLLTPPESRHPH